MNEAEWQTRRTRIDTRLRSLSMPWTIIPWSNDLDLGSLRCHAVTEFPTANGPADYALFVNGILLGIIEAKKVTVNPQNVLEQAKRYSRGAFNGAGDWNGFRVPFLFATNGEVIWFLDVRSEKPVSRQVASFQTPPALESMFTFDSKPAHDWLLDTPPDLITRLRDYQCRCIIATEQAILARRREILLALATGTGKTFLTVAQVYRLLESKFARRILFLVDRKALAAQAVREFNAFTTPAGNKFSQEYEIYSQRFQKEDFGDDDPFDPKVLPNEYLAAPKPSHTFVYVSTIQRMARNLFGAEGCFAQSVGDTETEADADRLDIPIHAFDLIIADECHRGYQHEAETGRFPKILIFAVNDVPHTSHADQLVKTSREVFNQGDAFVQKITGNPNVDRPLQRIREFRNRPNPKVVVTVDMLSTGVDIPALEFIVFLRPVKSRILWEQMLGRGTRRCNDINKAKFVVFDCFDGTLIRYFKSVSSFAIDPPRATPLTIPEIIDNIWQNIDRDYHVKVLVKRVLRIDKDMSGEARTQFAAWIADGDVERFARELPERLQQDFTGTMTLLRNPDFQNLLLEYPRAKRTFLTALEEKDTVTSEKLERYGTFDNAEDYLDAFEAFVKRNADRAAALEVLLQRPKDWRPAVFEELRRTLAREGFETDTLQRAHRARGLNALADIISLVKHAAAHQVPLLTAEQRVDLALDAFLHAHRFTTEQMQWLSLVREHLVKNLSMNEEDFDLTPLLEMRGGRAKARKVVSDLAELVGELNEAVAA